MQKAGEPENDAGFQTCQPSRDSRDCPGNCPSVPAFRKLTECPGIAANWLRFLAPVSVYESILETLQRWASEGSDTRYCAI